MIIGGLTVAALASTLYGADKSLKLDEQAFKKYAKAFEKSKEAELLIEKKAEFADKRLSNVAKKKRAIVNNTVPKFVEVYSQIQKVEMSNTQNINEFTLRKNVQELAVIESLKISSKKDFTDKELVCGLVTKGLGKLMVMDSERNLSAANNQLRSANVAYSQAETISAVYDAIIERADRISKLLMGMNALFVKSIEQTSKTIEKNGLNVKNYSENEKGILMTCVNMALAISDIINVPVVDEKGIIVESAIETILTGEQYIQKMNNQI